MPFSYAEWADYTQWGSVPVEQEWEMGDRVHAAMYRENDLRTIAVEGERGATSFRISVDLLHRNEPKRRWRQPTPLKEQERQSEARG